VLFFPYPWYVKEMRNSDRVRRYKRKELENFFIAFHIAEKSTIYNSIVMSCKGAGMAMLDRPSNNFNLEWTGYITNDEIKHFHKY
jgi:hypothetical protein